MGTSITEKKNHKFATRGCMPQAYNTFIQQTLDFEKEMHKFKLMVYQNKYLFLLYH